MNYKMKKIEKIEKTEYEIEIEKKIQFLYDVQERMDERSEQWQDESENVEEIIADLETEQGKIQSILITEPIILP